ncbi:G-patch-domain-containing protein [Gonapodya prolifera JEL478]|uniref:G-patch-domain-containing protein n=1 Tax=Gonapodya prolifera (strain JEL478) TaxID=1344416 RepID=A0A139AN17_GONPJ|nr:G-patch-domain-containing protein [Gonapodya prolifera JEL478]|eukprot:KXS18149.1 G-patch-domain-containing protein [Gonapodya prolifera JEL478]
MGMDKDSTPPSSPSPTPAFVSDVSSLSGPADHPRALYSSPDSQPPPIPAQPKHENGQLYCPVCDVYVQVPQAGPGPVPDENSDTDTLSSAMLAHRASIPHQMQLANPSPALPRAEARSTEGPGPGTRPFRIAGDNIGFRMLVKAGWRPGKGLGKDEDGRTTPVGVRKKVDRRGVGTRGGTETIVAERRSARSEGPSNSKIVGAEQTQKMGVKEARRKAEEERRARVEVLRYLKE